MIWQNVVFVGSNQGSGEGLPVCVLQTSVVQNLQVRLCNGHIQE